MNSIKYPVFYQAHGFEDDFIKYELFPGFEINHIENSDFLSFDYWKQTNSEFIGKNIIVFSSNPTPYNIIEPIIKFMKPLIIVHLSDEHGTKPEYNFLANYTKLLLRQYDFPHYKTSAFSNIIQIPLGYNINIVSSSSINLTSFKKTREREFSWGFIGGVVWKHLVKWDRLNGIKTFHSILPDKSYCSSNIPTNELGKYYSNTIFSPSGRGNGSIECFRHYELGLFGVIPVVVGGDAEIYSTFTYPELPPWIFADTWENAANKCKYLLERPDEIDEIRENIRLWWKNLILYFRDKISEALA